MSEFLERVDNVLAQCSTVETLCLAVGSIATIKGLVDFELIHPFLGIGEVLLGVGAISAATQTGVEKAN